MHELLFATSNKGKITSMRKRLNPLGIRVTQVELDLIEPQADTCMEISLIKARQAFEQLTRPVLVDDSAFHIPALNGFPGPYVKYVLHTIGGKGIIKLSEDITDRHSYFEGTLTYMFGNNTFKQFSDQSEVGIVTEQFQGPIRKDAWSELWNIFMPYGSTKVLAELDEHDRAALRKENSRVDLYDRFSDWFSSTLGHKEVIE